MTDVSVTLLGGRYVGTLRKGTNMASINLGEILFRITRD